MTELDPEKIYFELTEQIIKICRFEGGKWPEDKFYCLPKEAPSIAVDISEKISRYFQIWNVAESNLEETKEFIRRSLPTVYLWIEIGREIGRDMLKDGQDKNVIMDLYSDARFLRLYEERNLDNDDFKQNAVAAYFLLALTWVSKFFLTVEQAMVPRDESGSIAFTGVQYEAFIVALGALAIAQEAFNYGVRRYEIETGERLAVEIGESWVTNFQKNAAKIRHQPPQRFEQAFAQVANDIIKLDENKQLDAIHVAKLTQKILQKQAPLYGIKWKNKPYKTAYYHEKVKSLNISYLSAGRKGKTKEGTAAALKVAMEYLGFAE